MATKKKKKAAKKPAKKTAKKAAKKSTKKAAKKSAKKTAKKPAKKAGKKAAKKAAPKKTAKKMSAPKAAAPKAAPKTAKPKAATATNTGTHPLVGAELPAMTLTNQNGEAVDLGSLAQGNKKVVLYFYPKDDTPGCTAEACGFRDNMNRWQSAGIKVVGVSPDDAASHQKFIEKYGLNFDLLTDTDHKLADAMNVWKEKNFMGKSYMGVERSTFLLNDGKIAKAWQPVKVEGHVDDVLSTAEKV